MLTEVQRRSGLPSAAARGIALALTTAMVVTLVAPLPAVARQPARPGVSTAVATGTATDFSAARRRHHARRHLGRGFGPGVAMMGIMFGAIGAIANAERRRAYYEDAAPAYIVQQPYGGPVAYQDYDPGYGYAPQAIYQQAPVYAPGPVYRTAPVYAPQAYGARFHAGPPIVQGTPRFNVVRAIPHIVQGGRFQGRPRH